MAEQEQPKSLPPKKGFPSSIQEAIQRAQEGPDPNAIAPRGQRVIQEPTDQEISILGGPTLQVPDSSLEELTTQRPPVDSNESLTPNQNGDSSLEEIIRRATERRQSPPKENPRT